MSKFFVANEQIKDGKIYITGEDVNHIVNVLRLKVDDEILVCDKDSSVTYKTKIIEVLKEKVLCQVIEKVKETTESNVDVTIFQGLPKADKMEYIIQKGTELGVKKIVPVEMKRCIVKFDKKDEVKKIARWQKIAEVAAKQAGRDFIPVIENLIDINEIENISSDFDLIIVAYEEEKIISLKDELKKLKESYDNDSRLKIGVVIGPEGGLDKIEVENLKQNGAKVVTLGNRILRTETASIAILSNVMYEFEF